MKKLQYQIEINAPASVVYNKMLGIDNIETYQQWTEAFNPTSTYEGNWEKDSKIYFIGTGEDGKKGGMVSKIKENIPNKFVSISHLGFLVDDKEVTEGPEIEKWSGSLENYTFFEAEGITTVKVEVDVAEEYVDHFNEYWDKALIKLKEICEN